MAAYFLDTSTVVKRYVRETGTRWVQALTDPAAGHFLFVARIMELEMAGSYRPASPLPGSSDPCPRCRVPATVPGTTRRDGPPIVR